MDQTACKPGSVPPRENGTRRPFLWTGHCWPVLATYPDDWAGEACPPGRNPKARRPDSVLLQAGLAMPSPSPGPRWALTPPFHPYPRAQGPRAVCFLWRYPWGHPRRALPAAFSPWSPDFPPPSHGRERPPGRLIRREIGLGARRGQADSLAARSRATSRARVSPSATPSTRSGRQWRWKAVTTVVVSWSKAPDGGRS